MEEQVLSSEYLVISRGQWDKDLSPDVIADCDRLYVWLDRLVSEGRMKPGQRLADTGKTVFRKAVTDGPYGEAKEVIGGYWFILARSLDKASEIAAGNPVFELRLVL